MCHARLAVDLAPGVNFVSGANGSGKSALLQAAQLALGVRASEVGRARSAAGLVRAGAASARVRVTLWNSGPAAHRPDAFGPEIVIEARVPGGGGGAIAWSLRGAGGDRLGSTRR